MSESEMGRYDESLRDAEAFVRKCLEGFGQHEDDATIRAVAEKVLKALPEGEAPLKSEEILNPPWGSWRDALGALAAEARRVAGKVPVSRFDRSSGGKVF